MIRIGSLFTGIAGLDRGVEQALAQYANAPLELRPEAGAGAGDALALAGEAEVLAGGVPYIDGWADRARAQGILVDDPLRGFDLGTRRRFAKHFTTTTPRWKPGDRPLNLAEDAWTWPGAEWLQPFSRREQLLSEAECFEEVIPDAFDDDEPRTAAPAQLGLSFWSEAAHG